MTFTRQSTPRIALVTCSAQPLLYGEEREFVALLRSRGVDARPVVWDDPSVDWSRFDGIFLRSTWDYFRRYAEFCAWLSHVEKCAPIWNPAGLVRWNLDKGYLRELEQRGVRVVPTVFCEAGRPADLAAILADKGWAHAVMKPAVSGNAFRTYRVQPSDASAHQHEMDAILTSTTVLVQPFLPEIQSEGEWSLVFLEGAFSHAILKVPTAGDYRVQPEFGGRFQQVVPPPGLLAQARAVLDALPEAAVYARIDGVRRGDDFYLMEAELIEPYLYTSAAPGSAEAYVALVERLARRSLSSRSTGEALDAIA